MRIKKMKLLLNLELILSLIYKNNALLIADDDFPFRLLDIDR